MDYLSSMYIDNEMDLDEKSQFVEKIHSDQSFYVQTLELLKQEQELRKMPEMPAMATATPWRPPFRAVLDRLLKPMGAASCFSADSRIPRHRSAATASSCTNHRLSRWN